MKLSEFMAEVALTPTATGEVDASLMVLAVDCSADGTAESPADYDIASVHTENLGATVNAKTVDKSYLYEGESTIKTGAQRTFNVTGQRYLGDTFQDFCCGHDIVYGVGTAVQRKYVYFNALTGAGESGTATITTKKDGAAASGNPTDFEIELKGIGRPVAYTYEADSE